MHEMHSDDTETFVESGAPPAWLRALVALVCGAWLAFGYALRGADGAAGAAVGVALLLVAYGGLELGQRLYGGVVVDRTHLRVGTRRSVALSDLDLATLRDQAGMETFAVFGERNLRSAPIWLRDTVALQGRDERGPISVVIRTARRAELVESLTAGSRRAAESPRPGAAPSA